MGRGPILVCKTNVFINYQVGMVLGAQGHGWPINVCNTCVLTKLPGRVCRETVVSGKCNCLGCVG